MIFSFVACSLVVLWFDLLPDQLLHNKMSTSNQTVYTFQVHMVIITTTVVISNNDNNNNNKDLMIRQRRRRQELEKSGSRFLV